MRVISMKRLRQFWEKYPDAELPLRAWYKTAEKANWASIADVHKIYPQADAVKLDCEIVVTVFNIRGNNCRLICVIEYEVFHVYVKFVLTHKQYDNGQWKVKLCRE